MTMVDMLIFFLLASQAINTFGKTIVLREENNARERKLTCFSEDDGSALVWNDVISEESLKKSRLIRFYNVDQIKPDKNKIDCKMKKSDECLKSWITKQWNFTESFITPLGPVFDKRWEEFTQHGLFDRHAHFVTLKNTTAFSFSIRNKLKEINVIICNSPNISRQGLCYLITMGSSNNSMSTIRKCPAGISLISQEKINKECNKIKGSFKHSPLSSTKWRTFLIMWNSVTRNISVYDADNNDIFIKYRDEEKSNSTSIYSTFIYSNDSAFIRLHTYTFLHTTVENTTLTSPIFQFDNGTICIQLLIGLCAECDINIVLFNAIRDKELKKLTVKGSLKAAIHGLPTWQFVTIEHLTKYDNAIMELTPKLNSKSSNPLWAVANVRQCPKTGSLRKSIMLSKHNLTRVWPNVTCQKLFYDNRIVVSSIWDAKLNMKLDDAECPEGRIGPRCLEFCKRDDEGNHVCKASAICFKDGCTCPAGYVGAHCTKPCEKNTYGHDCKKACGSCMTKQTKQEQSTSLCNIVNGTCNYGCNINPEKLYIPPLCQMSINKPRVPIISLLSARSILLKHPMIWKDKYEGSLSYSFRIRGRDGISNNYNWKPIFQNTTNLLEYCGNLDPGTIYHIAFALRFCQHSMLCNVTESEWQTTETNCRPSDGFLLKIEKLRLTINTKPNASQDLCPPNWYRLIVQNTNTDKEILNTSLHKFPYEVSSLPITTITVIILHKNQKIFSETISTSEEVPSEISNIKILSVSNTNVILTWTAPNQPRNKILRYSIMLQVREYFGCENSFALNNPSTKHWTNSTRITIQKLHPYTKYGVEIVAYNSGYSSAPAKITFETKTSVTVTEVFSRINVQGWNMTWKPPKDCKTIMGPLNARIEIRGISDVVKDFYTVKNTSNYYLSLNDIPLYGAEQYVAKLYVIRYAIKYTSIPSIYQAYGFETSPGVPPRVTKLEVYEIDNRQKPPVVHLRWQSPLPPLNGTLRTYRIRSCNATKCANTDVQLNAMCTLWDNYICGSIQTYYDNQTIEVVAYNMGVPEPGVPFEVSKTMLDKTMLAIPDKPSNFSITVLNNSVVDLQWYHPWKTGNHLKYFYIQIYLTSTNFQKLCEEDDLLKTRGLPTTVKLSVTNYTRYYSKRLYLFPSTRYIVSIQAVTYANKFSETMYKTFKTPSTLTFNGHLEYMLYDSIYTISLNIPPVLNNTQNSMMHIIVKGPQETKSCETHSKIPEDLQAYVGIDANDVAWQAAELPTLELAGKPFIVGNNLSYGNAKNCPLRSKEFYEITVIITEHNQNVHNKPNMLKISIFNATESSTEHKKWLIFIILIFVVPGAAFYFYQSKKRQKTQQTDTILAEYVTYDDVQMPDQTISVI